MKKHLDFLIVVCYNIEVAWRDGRVGLRRTTGNRVYPNRYQGFESLSLRQINHLNRGGFLLSIAKYFVYNRDVRKFT